MPFGQTGLFHHHTKGSGNESVWMIPFCESDWSFMIRFLPKNSVKEADARFKAYDYVI